MGEPRTLDDVFLPDIASGLCMDAQTNGYDHGANPTLVSFKPPYCPRHLAIASRVRDSLIEDEARSLSREAETTESIADDTFADRWPSLSREGLREYDVRLLANVILGGSSYLPHREAAERVLVALLSSPPDRALSEGPVRYGYQRGHADAEYQRGYREELAVTNWRTRWDERAVLLREDAARAALSSPAQEQGAET